MDVPESNSTASAMEELTSATTPTVSPTTQQYADFLDPWKRKVAEIVMDYIVCFSVAALGVVTNTLVILVYARIGFRESVSISMTTIAVWDFFKCLAGLMERMSGLIGVWSKPAAVSWDNIMVVVGSGVICFSSYVTSVMAAYVAVERCLCVSVPLKVKWMLTPKVTLTACLVISVVVFGLFVVMFFIYDIVWTFDASLNATVAIYRNNDFFYNHHEPLFMYYNLSGILWPLAAFVVIVVCTVIIMYKLRQGSKFRSGQNRLARTTSGGQAQTLELSERHSQQHRHPNSSQHQQHQQHQMSNRDRQVVKMLLVIITIYIASLAPRISHYIAKYIIYEFYFLRYYRYLFEFVLYWLWVADLVNGTANFFVFYAMSSTFRATFKEMFSRKSNTASSGNKGNQ